MMNWKLATPASAGRLAGDIFAMTPEVPSHTPSGLPIRPVELERLESLGSAHRLAAAGTAVNNSQITGLFYISVALLFSCWRVLG
jgi:hypothetical protein